MIEPHDGLMSVFVRYMLLVFTHQPHGSAADISRRLPSEAGPDRTCSVLGPSAMHSDSSALDATSCPCAAGLSTHCWWG